MTDLGMLSATQGHKALAAQARAASGFSAWASCRQTALCCHQRGCIIHTGITSSCQRRLGNGVGNMQGLLLKSRRNLNLKPTKPASAIEISDADRHGKRKILITDKCTMAFKNP